MPPPRHSNGPRSIGTSAEGLLVAPHLDWVLACAFRTTELPWKHPFDGREAFATALRLGLLSRIVHGLGPDRLAAELGREPAQEALAAYRESALASAKLVAMARLVGRVASEGGIRVVALKHVALCLAGISSPAARGAVDADVLVADSDAGRLTEALAGVGIAVSTAPAYEHQHRPLVHREAGMLELHRTVPGVRLWAGAPDATLEALVEQDLATPISLEEPFLLVPRPHVLLGHALAHALFQHGLEPQAYPPWKLLADLDDLRRSAGAALLSDALPLVTESVADEDARAAWALPPLLATQGTAALLARPESPEARLLTYLVRGALEPEYAESLRLRAVFGLSADRSGFAGLLGSAWHALAITPAQARNLYGAKTPLTYALALAWRPFHLAGKLLRYALAALR